MTKQAERDYLEKTGEMGRAHSLHKPFSNPDCGLTLASIGAIMNLMPPRPARILDLGCGGGWTSVFFAKYGYEVVGQDLAVDMIELAMEAKALNGVGDNLRFIVSDYEGLTFRDEFDCAVFFDCLHHAVDEAAAIGSVFAALKPGGIMITHEPGEGHSTMPYSIEAMRLYGVNERDMPPHLIIAQGEKAGFRDAQIFPMQHELLELFYRPRYPRLWSKSGLKLARRILRLVFGADPRQGAIVVMRKPG